MSEVEKCPNPRKPLRVTPTAQIGGRDMIVQFVPYTARYSLNAHFLDKGDKKAPFFPLSV